MNTESMTSIGTGINEGLGTTISSPTLFSSPENSFTQDSIVTEYSLNQILSLPNHSISGLSTNTTENNNLPDPQTYTPLTLSLPATSIFIDGSETATPVSLGSFGTIYKNQIAAQLDQSDVENINSVPLSSEPALTNDSQSTKVIESSSDQMEEFSDQISVIEPQEILEKNVVPEHAAAEIQTALSTYEALIAADIPQQEAKEIVIEALENKPEGVQESVQTQLELQIEKTVDTEIYAEAEVFADTDEIIDCSPLSEEDEQKRFKYMLAKKNAQEDFEELYWIDEEANKARIQLIIEKGKELGKQLPKGKKLRGLDIVNKLPNKTLVPPELLSELVRVDYFTKGKDGSYNRIVDDIKKDTAISADPEKLKKYAKRLTVEHTAVRYKQLFDESVATPDEVYKVLDADDWNIFK